jgi:hypothetical protein
LFRGTYYWWIKALTAADGFNCTTHRSVGYVLAIPRQQVLDFVRGCYCDVECIDCGSCGQSTTPNQRFGDFDRVFGNVELGNSF